MPGSSKTSPSQRGDSYRMLAAAFSLQISPTGEPIWIQRAGRHRFQDGATWLVIVRTIAEFAGRGEFGDLGE